METPRGSAAAIQEAIRLGNKISVNEMVKISEKVEAIGGALIALEPDDDWCGTGHFRVKWPPPRPEAFVKLIDTLVASKINFEVLINGIPVPEEILMKVSRNIGR